MKKTYIQPQTITRTVSAIAMTVGSIGVSTTGQDGNKALSKKSKFDDFYDDDFYDDDDDK